MVSRHRNEDDDDPSTFEAELAMLDEVRAEMRDELEETVGMFEMALGNCRIFFFKFVLDISLSNILLSFRAVAGIYYTL